MKNLYITLDIIETASADEIKRAYRKLALKYHPDRVQVWEKEYSADKFKEINFAYTILIDTKKRGVYDKYGTTEENELGDNLERVLRKFNEDLREETQDVTEAIVENFNKAKEEGGIKRQCSSCNGTGIVTKEKGFFIIKEQCSICQGKGFIDVPPAPVYEYRHKQWWEP